MRTLQLLLNFKLLLAVFVLLAQARLSFAGANDEKESRVTSGPDHHVERHTLQKVLSPEPPSTADAKRQNPSLKSSKVGPKSSKMEGPGPMKGLGAVVEHHGKWTGDVTNAVQLPVKKLSAGFLKFLQERYEHVQTPSEDQFKALALSSGALKDEHEYHEVNKLFEEVGVYDPKKTGKNANAVQLRTLLKRHFAEYLRLETIVRKYEKKWRTLHQLVSYGIGRKYSVKSSKSKKGVHKVSPTYDYAINVRLYDFEGIDKNFFDWEEKQQDFYFQLFLSPPNRGFALERKVADNPLRYGTAFAPCSSTADAGDGFCTTGPIISDNAGAIFTLTAMHCFIGDAVLGPAPHAAPIGVDGAVLPRHHACNFPEQYSTGPVVGYGFVNPAVGPTIEAVAFPVNALGAAFLGHAAGMSTQMLHPNGGAAPWNTQGWYGSNWYYINRFRKWLATFADWNRVAKFGARTQFTTGEIEAIENGIVHVPAAHAPHPRWWLFEHNYVVRSNMGVGSPGFLDADDNAQNNFGNAGDSGGAVVFDFNVYGGNAPQVVGITSNGGWNAPAPALHEDAVPVAFTVFTNNPNRNSLVPLTQPLTVLLPIGDALRKVRHDTGNNNLNVV